MGFGNVSGCTRSTSYERAATMFLSPKPRSSKWDENERPLDDTSKWHYRVTRPAAADPDYYDVCLYHTTMARYYKPQPDGKYLVAYTGDNSSTSSQFLWQVCDVRMGVNMDTDTEGNKVLWPLSTHNIRGDQWSAVIARDRAGRIVTSDSTILQMYTTYYDEDDKDWRNAAVVKLADYIDLARMQFQQDPSKKGDSWMHGVTSNVVVNYVRGLGEMTESAAMALIGALVQEARRELCDTDKQAHAAMRARAREFFGNHNGVKVYPKWSTDIPKRPLFGWKPA